MPQLLPDGLASALGGSFTPASRIDSWYSGNLTAGNLPLAAGEVVFDSSVSIAGQLTATFAGDADNLDPLASYSAPLACYGSQLNVRAGISLPDGPALASLGWFLITESEPAEEWARYTLADGTTAWATRGRQVRVTGLDRLVFLEDDQLLTPEQPAALTSVKAELARLVGTRVPLGDFTAVADGPIPTGFTYSGPSRLEAVFTLAALLSAAPRMAGDGTITLRPMNPPATPTATLSVDANAVSMPTQKITRAGIVNSALALPELPLALSALRELAGPLAPSGPFGRRNIAVTSAAVVDDASAALVAAGELSRLDTGRSVIVSVQASADPSIVLGDRVRVVTPRRELVGIVRRLAFTLPLSTMSLDIAVPSFQVLP